MWILEDTTFFLFFISVQRDCSFNSQSDCQVKPHTRYIKIKHNTVQNVFKLRIRNDNSKQEEEKLEYLEQNAKKTLKKVVKSREDQGKQRWKVGTGNRWRRERRIKRETKTDGKAKEQKEKRTNWRQWKTNWNMEDGKRNTEKIQNRIRRYRVI